MNTNKNPFHVLRVMAKAKGKQTFFTNLFISLLVAGSTLIPSLITGVVVSDVVFNPQADNMSMIISAIFTILVDIVVTAPVFMGLYRVYFMLITDNKVMFVDVFYYFESFKKYFRAVALAVIIHLKLLPIILFFSFCIFFFSFSALILNILVIVTIVALLVYGEKLNVINIIAVQNEGMSIKEAVEYAKYLTEGRTMSIATFYFSFLPWMILATATGGLLSVFYIGYYNLSFIAYVEILKMQKDLENGATVKFTSENEISIIIEDDDAEKTADENSDDSQATQEVTDAEKPNLPEQSQNDDKA